MDTDKDNKKDMMCKFDLDSFDDLWSEDNRGDLNYLARSAEAAERYDDMCCCMSKIVEICKGEKKQLTVDERNLLSVAYKNVIGVRRTSWRTLNAESLDEKNEGLITKFKSQVEEELKCICKEVLGLLEKSLISKDDEDRIKKAAKNKPEDTDNSEDDTNKKKDNPVGEAQVFYLKMAGDYYRYLAEALASKENEQSSSEYYRRAFELSEVVLEPTHPIRLGLALNYSVCYYEILKDKKRACELAKEAFDNAISKLDKLEENDYKDSTLIMQLLRDNLTLWTQNKDPDEDGDNNNNGNNVGDGD